LARISVRFFCNKKKEKQQSSGYAISGFSNLMSNILEKQNQSD